jgi:hypothetical protein
MARYQPIARQFDIARQATAEATKRLLVETAKREHAKVMKTAPRPQAFTRVVDGRRGLPEEAVSAFGRIDYLYPRLEAVAQFAMEKLFEFSPVDSGEYRNSHTLFLNGQSVSNLSAWKAGDEVSIANPVPYARKIEVGAMTMRVPGTDHVYERASRSVKRRYGAVANIRFTFRGVVAGGGGRGANRIDRDTRQPVLLITER